MLLDFRGRYHRYLHQDEFGPSRADRAKALRAFVAQLDRLIRQLTDLGLQTRRHIELGIGHSEVLKQASEFDCVATRDGDHDAIAQIYEAAARRRDADVRLTASDLKILAKLQAASDAAWCMIGLLDTTTDDEMLDSRIEVGANRLQREGGGDARFAIILARISRLRARAATALDRLNRQKGLEPHRSLRFLVWWLCELWREETGQPVTSSASQGGDYIGIPRSPAGRFVLAAVEALQPSSEWFEQHAPFATRVSAVPLTKGGFMLARVVHNLLAEYVACQSGSADSVRPGHPKKAAHTF